ncbi:MAG: M67 family metallopeptidase [Chloroflexi bacterium]|nr:M67 family metallopeptidase [Chloroflexota bacterium]
MAEDTINLEERYAREMIAHAREEAPNECCGILAGSDSQITELFRAENSEASPTRYSIAPKDLLRIYRVIEYSGWEFLGIYHSHVASEAYPSPTDVKLAFWPDSLYFIISLLASQPSIRAFRIVDGEITEVKVAQVVGQT